MILQKNHKVRKINASCKNNALKWLVHSTEANNINDDLTHTTEKSGAVCPAFCCHSGIYYKYKDNIDNLTAD